MDERPPVHAGTTRAAPGHRALSPGDKRWPSGGGLKGREHGIDALRFRNAIGGGIDEKVVCATTALHNNNAK